MLKNVCAVTSLVQYPNKQLKKQETFLHVVSMDKECAQSLMMDNEVNGFVECLSVLVFFFFLCLSLAHYSQRFHEKGKRHLLLL